MNENDLHARLLAPGLVGDVLESRRIFIQGGRFCKDQLRADRGRFDVVVMLAVIHHMMVSDGIPLDEILSLAAELTRDSVIIEFIPRDDPMFQRILRGRDELYADYSQQAFEAACREKFEISRRGDEKGGQRTLYWLRLRQK